MLDITRYWTHPKWFLDENEASCVVPPLRTGSGKPLDAILVLGGGLEEDGSVSSLVKARLDGALKFKDRASYFMTLSKCSFYKGQTQVNGESIVEARVDAKYLIERGVDPQKVLVEGGSLDTIENAYFARRDFTDKIGLRKLLVVTSGFHAMKSCTIFEWVFGLEPRSDYSVHYYAVPNVGLSKDTLGERKEWEFQRLDVLGRLVPRIKTMEEFERYHSGEYLSEHKRASPSESALRSF